MAKGKIYSLSNRPKSDLKVHIIKSQTTDVHFTEARLNNALLFNALSGKLNSNHAYKLMENSSCGCSGIPASLMKCGFNSSDMKYYAQEMERIERSANDKVKQRWDVLLTNPYLPRAISYRTQMANFSPFTYCCTCDVGRIPCIGFLKEIPCICILDNLQLFFSYVYIFTILAAASVIGAIMDIFSSCFVCLSKANNSKASAVLPQSSVDEEDIVIDSESSWLTMYLFGRYPQLDSSWIDDDVLKQMQKLAEELTRRVNDREDHHKFNLSINIRAESYIISCSETAYATYVASSKGSADINLTVFHLTCRYDVNHNVNTVVSLSSVQDSV